MITEDYVSFETAKLLKDKRFNEPCYAYWHEDENRLIISQSMYPIKNITNPCFFGPGAPTLQMAMKWLREVHNIHIAVNLTYSEEPKLFPPEYYVYIDNTLTGEPLIKEACSLVQDETLTPKGFKHSEEACEAAIMYCLENLI